MSDRTVYRNTEQLKNAIEENINQIEKPPALICNSHITGLSVARALGKEGVPVIALDREEKGLGFASRYVALRGLCPNPDEEEEAFIQFLLEIGPFFKQKCVLFPCMDEWALAIARHAERLSDYYIWQFSSYKTIDQILDKSQLYQKAEDLNVLIPQSDKVTSENLEELSDTFSYPVVLKPIQKRKFYDRFRKALFVAGSKEEFKEKVKLSDEIELVVQEQIPSTPGGLVTVVAYMDQDNNIRGSLTGRRLEIYPAESGTTCLVESVENAKLVERASEVLKAFQYQGIAECEFIYDERDEEYKLIDINTRPWKWIGLPVSCNVNLPYLLYRDAIGDPFTAEKGQVGKKWVFVQDYISLKESKQGMFEGDVLSKEEWLAVLSGRTEKNDLITTAVESQGDPEPAYQLLQNKFSKRKYYCPC
ncbi:carboxylate--amine ligase [Pseudalkalibacillus caeni]|uniref:Carboxylate--amine ligase n=1 Tax=Exobacillus caeni TaxID=2574798 RepID=A0A5R9EW87_9BACL|nr:carboxylate--amine ligase [Pseudalkalibacillus caeni]TLS34899.1 carboxylate--amine ligase [Pseudalkalibacillus caeni]